MTTSILLGTKSSKKEVIIAARAVGFNEKLPYKPTYKHEKVDNLALQIQAPPTALKGVEGVITQMEFDDYSERFPNNPEAIDVLRELYGQLPDIQYSEILPLPEKPKSLVELSPIKPLSEYFDSLE